MYERMRSAYGRLRGWPGVGSVASRAVWAAKGALGRPVRAPAGAVLHPVPPRRRAVAPAATSGDARLLVALAAIDALQERLARLEAGQPGEAAPALDAYDGVASRPGSVSVVISTLDRAAWLHRALSALAYQSHGDREIIVVAGPSGDDTDAVLARHAAHIQVVRCREANLSVSRNLGLAAATGEVVAFLDDDAAPEPDWLQELLRPYDDPEVGGVGGPIRDAGGVDFQCRVMVSDRLGVSAEAGALDQARIDPPGPGARRFLSLTGANSSFRRSALLQVGGFDEAYAYFLDETDLCLRLVEAGWRLHHAPAAEVHHAYAPNAQRRADRAPLSLYASARSTAYFAFRNAGEALPAPALAEHLQRYAEGLRHDIGWRLGAGVCTAEEAQALTAEVDAGLAEGVKLALAGPRRLLPVLPQLPPQAAPERTRRARAPSPHDPDRLKLCLLSQQYPGADQTTPVGGVAVWTHALAVALAGRGAEVTVMARAGADLPSRVAFEAEAGGAGVWVHRIACDPLLQGPRHPLLAGAPASVTGPAEALAAEVARVAARRRFDLVMGPLWDVEPAALVGGPWPVAVSLHTACAQMPSFKPEWDERYRREHVAPLIAAERRLLQNVEQVVTNSRAAARDIGSALGLPELAYRAVHIPHGLPDLAAGVRPGPRAAEGVEVLFVGRLERRKGVATLLDCAPVVLALDPHIRLTLVGEAVEPGLRDRFLAAHNGAPWLDRLRFDGPLARAELHARYAAADLVVVPSLYESFGLTALEAMIFAKPCIASRVGGLAELVVDGETGRLTPPGDAEALAAAILSLARSPLMRARMGAAGRRLYLARYTAEAMAHAFEGWARQVRRTPTLLAAE